MTAVLPGHFYQWERRVEYLSANENVWSLVPSLSIIHLVQVLTLSLDAGTEVRWQLQLRCGPGCRRCLIELYCPHWEGALAYKQISKLPSINIVTFGIFLIGIFSLTLRSQKEGWTVRCDMRCDVRCGVVEVEGLQPVDCRRTHDTVTSYVLPVICLFTLCSLFALISRRNCCVQCDAGLQPTRVNVTAT